MPPIPKRPDQRQRRNRTTTAARLEAAPATRVPLAALREWQPASLAWWETIWASPMADEWVDGDVPGLTALAVLIDTFWINGDPKVHAEIRMASREFGLSPLSRRQLQWEIHKLEAATKPTAPSSRRGRPKFALLTGSKAG